MQCRKGCGACCIVISISSSLPRMPHGKPAGIRCVHLIDDNTCELHDAPNYPAVCAHLKPSKEMCGEKDSEAIEYLTKLEELTKP
jgi:uncharacterized protein